MHEAYEGRTLRSWLSRSLLPCRSRSCSSSWSESKWSSMARLEAPVMNTSRVAPAARASSTAYCMRGLSTTGSISLGLALVAGRKRVPRPATGNTAVRITDFGVILIGTLREKIVALLPSVLRKAHAALQESALSSLFSAHLKTAGRMLSQERHLGQRQYQPTLSSPQSSHW